MTAFINPTVWDNFITVMFGSVRRQKLMIAFASVFLPLYAPWQTLFQLSSPISVMA